ncbi:MAG: SLBB domain-containing protein [Candidatus Fermentibacteria bacterium]
MIFLLLLLIAGEESTDLIPLQPMIEAVDPAEYIVGPGDILWFSIRDAGPALLMGNPDGSVFYMTITPDGYAVVPSTGAWLVAGLRLNEATSLIEAGFAARYPGLRCMAGLAVIRTFRIPLSGQVASQGIYEIDGASRLSDLLDMAGGIASAGSWTSIQIFHSNGDTTEIDLTRFLLNGCMHSNPTLSLGDRVHIPQAEEFVSIEGAVKMSGFTTTAYGGGPETNTWSGSIRGTVEYIPEETVSGLVRRVGGTRAWASRDNCYIMRILPDGTEGTIRAPLDNPSIDPELLPGDRVVCPGIPPVVMVSGFVHAPGVFSHTAGMDVFYYISQAGGLLREASGSGVKIVLPDGNEVRSSDAGAITPGSTVVVPRKAIVGWEDPLLIFTSIASIIIAWKSLE